MRILAALVFLASLMFSAMPIYAAPSAADFGALPAIKDAALSPNGKEIAIIFVQEGQYVVRVLELANMQAAPRFVTLGEGVKPLYVKWVNDGRVMVSFSQYETIDGRPIPTGYLYTLNIQTMKGDILINPAKARTARMGTSSDVVFRQFNNRVVDWLEDDPQHILMSFSETSNTHPPDLRKVDVETGRNTIVKRRIFHVQRWYTDERGEPRIGQGRNLDNTSEWVLRIRGANDDNWLEASDYPGLRADAAIHGFTSDPNEVIVESTQSKDTIGLYVYDLSHKSITRKIFHDETYDASGVVRDSSGDVIGAQYISDALQTELIGAGQTSMSRMRAKFSGSTVKYRDSAQSGSTVLFTVSNSTDPGYLMLLVGNGEPRSLGKLHPKLPTEDMGEVVSVSYTARDGQKIPSFVTLPPSITGASQLKGLPFIVLPHGGPFTRDVKGFDYSAQFFASLGYGVLQMNYRGSVGYGQTYSSAGKNNWEILQQDVEDGTKWLVSKGYADPKRICIAGYSYGGYAALMGAAKTPELYACAISMAGLTDIKSFIRDQSRFQFGKESLGNFFGGFTDSDDVRENSPVKLAADIITPILLAHGERDLVVEFSQYERMKNALRRSKSKVTYLALENGDHYLSNEDNRKRFYREAEAFLKRVNGKSEFAH